MDLQSALRGILPQITPATPAAPAKPKAKAKAKAKAKLPRRLAVGSFDCGRKAFDTTGTVGRFDPSRPPPVHPPGYSEHRCDPHRIHLSTTRALRLWSKTEVK
jgi:hypothetical protein